jgi:hypothetical protein
MINAIWAAFILFSIPEAVYAGHSDAASSNSGRPIIYCEVLLSTFQNRTKSRELEREFYGRPFTLFEINRLTPAGIAKMGLEPLTSLIDLRNSVLTVGGGKDERSINVTLGKIRGGKFMTLVEYGFTDDRLAGWKMILMGQNETAPSYDELVRDHINEADVETFGKIGFRSAPDADGVRHFVAFSDGFGGDISQLVTFGLDVPCDQVEDYTEDVIEMVDDLHTPDNHFCRIPVLTYSRADYSEQR